MSGFGKKFKIYRKYSQYSISFIGFWDGKLSTASTWEDKDTNNNDLSTSDTTLLPRGYRGSGSSSVSADLNFSANLTEFSIGAVIVRDSNANNESIFYRALGSSHYPRMYFEGTTLYVEYQLDSVVKTITVSIIDTYITNGHPSSIIFRAKNTVGGEVLIDGVSVGTNTDTGTDFDVSTSDSVFMYDTNKSYGQIGDLRLAYMTDTYLTNNHIAALENMFDFEGYYDVVNDKMTKWTGSGNLITASATSIGTSPYVGLLVETT